MIYLREFHDGKFNSDRFIACVTDQDAAKVFDEEKDPNMIVCVKAYYCDGSGWNGTACRYMVVDEDDIVIERSELKVRLTNNDMEYLAVKAACDCAEDGSVIFTDSMLVVEQVNGNFRTSAKFIDSRDYIIDMMQKKGLLLRWIGRDNNLAGKRLER
jgi:hypothetical protein